MGTNGSTAAPTPAGSSERDGGRCVAGVGGTTAGGPAHRRHVHPGARLSRAALAARVVEVHGGRFSRAMGINVDAGAWEVERWLLAATLFGNRISARLASRAYRVLADAGVRTPRDVARRSWKDLVALLDAGGYARYDFRTASRLEALTGALPDNALTALTAIRDPRRLEEALDALPGWGPVTVRLFLRELRGVWPAARPPVDARAVAAAVHLGLFDAAPISPAQVGHLARAAAVDVRDLEAGLVRLWLAHGRSAAFCPGGARCTSIQDAALGLAKAAGTGPGRRRRRDDVMDARTGERTPLTRPA